MKLSAFVAAAGAVSLVSAQSITNLVNQIPGCALNCFLTTVPKYCPGGVKATLDYGCQCAKKDQLKKVIGPCVIKACGQQKALGVQDTTNKICSVYSAQNAGGSSTKKSTTMSSKSTKKSSSGMGSGTPSTSKMSTTRSRSMNSAPANSTPAAGGNNSPPKPKPTPKLTGPTDFTGVSDLLGGAPMATARPIGMAIAAAIAFAL